MPEQSEYDQLRRQCELTKITLYQQEEVTINVSLNNTEHRCEITRNTFEDLNAIRFLKCTNVIREVMRHVSISRSVRNVLLVGGSTSIPCLQSEIVECFTSMNTPVSVISSEDAVAHGAAIQVD